MVSRELPQGLRIFPVAGLETGGKGPCQSKRFDFCGIRAGDAPPPLVSVPDGSLTYSGFPVDSYRQTGWSIQTVLIILIRAVLQTALSEEIFSGASCAGGSAGRGAGKPGPPFCSARAISRLCGEGRPSGSGDCPADGEHRLCPGLALPAKGGGQHPARLVRPRGGEHFEPNRRILFFCFERRQLVWKRGTGRRSRPSSLRRWW